MSSINSVNEVNGIDTESSRFIENNLASLKLFHSPPRKNGVNSGRREKTKRKKYLNRDVRD